MPKTADSSRRPAGPARVALVSFALVVAGAIGIAGRAPAHRANLSDDLSSHERRQTTAPARVIVHGSRSAIRELAGRHHVDVVRWLSDGAVLRADSNGISRL